MSMLNIYDMISKRKTAILQNAFDIVESQELNQIYSLSFKLPATDDKVQYCQPRHFVRWGDDGELYRIKAPKVSQENTSIIQYDCEHVITTLCDSWAAALSRPETSLMTCWNTRQNATGY